MKLLVFCARWGMQGTPEQQMEQIARAGYDGIECFLKPDLPPAAEFSALAARYGLQLIMDGHVDHVDALPAVLQRLTEYRPLHIGLQSGRDSMSTDEGYAFFEAALRLEAQLGISVGHETHRGRALFTPWTTAYYLQQFPELKIIADFSHWVNVCERLPDDQSAALDLACQRTLHIHSRAGYEQGPQVPDPAAPEYERHVAWHEAQWKLILEHAQRAGKDQMTVTPEYGPPDYLHTLPYTRSPVADLWHVRLWAAQRMRHMAQTVGQ